MNGAGSRFDGRQTGSDDNWAGREDGAWEEEGAWHSVRFSMYPLNFDGLAIVGVELLEIGADGGAPEVPDWKTIGSFVMAMVKMALNSLAVTAFRHLASVWLEMAS